MRHDKRRSGSVCRLVLVSVLVVATGFTAAVSPVAAQNVPRIAPAVSVLNASDSMPPAVSQAQRVTYVFDRAALRKAIEQAARQSGPVAHGQPAASTSRSNRRRGALIGAGIGCGICAVLMGRAASADDGDGITNDHVLGFAAVGAGIGALVGYGLSR